MKLLFIRHSLAVERDEFEGHDFDRPLSEKGVKRAKKFFKHIKEIYPQINYILTSKALRAKQTAKILNSFYHTEYEEHSLLYPGATITDLKEVLKGKEGIVAIVGHEPDLSGFLKELMYAPNLKIKFKKPSLAEFEEELKSLIHYKHFEGV
jgi:phosphohistidine phosphatase